MTVTKSWSKRPLGVKNTLRNDLESKREEYNQQQQQQQQQRQRAWLRLSSFQANLIIKGVAPIFVPKFGSTGQRYYCRTIHLCRGSFDVNSALDEVSCSGRRSRPNFFIPYCPPHWGHVTSPPARSIHDTAYNLLCTSVSNDGSLPSLPISYNEPLHVTKTTPAQVPNMSQNPIVLMQKPRTASIGLGGGGGREVGHNREKRWEKEQAVHDPKRITLRGMRVLSSYMAWRISPLPGLGSATTSSGFVPWKSP